MEVILSIDQSTQSNKIVFFNTQLEPLYFSTSFHEQKCEKPGWYEHDPEEILEKIITLMNEGLAKLKEQYSNIIVTCIGISNQRETVVIWDKKTGKPLYNAIVWLDTRCESLVNEFSEKYNNEIFQQKTGACFNTYFSAFKILWLIQNNEEIKEKLSKGEALIGNINTWLIYHLTNGCHYTDVTNASRTLLMDIKTLQWSEELCAMFGITNMSVLPEIKSNCSNFGVVKHNKLHEYLNVPITGCAGDQHAACVGQGIFDEGEAKCTYGTGAFLLVNTGTKIVYSSCGLLTTVCYKIREHDKAYYALEGSIGTAGSGVSWLVKNNFIKDCEETNEIMDKYKDTGGVVFVPAFSGLFAPRWRSDARACIYGMTFNSDKNHIVRALLEGIVFQLYEIIDSLLLDLDLEILPVLRCDGGMTKNKSFMQFNSDIIRTKIEVSTYKELTLVGAAVLAGIGSNIWKDLDQIKRVIKKSDTVYYSIMEKKERIHKIGEWTQAVEKTLYHKST